MCLFLLLFLLSSISAAVPRSSESPPSNELSNLDADTRQNGAVQGMQDYGKVIRPIGKYQGNGTMDRCLQKCTLEAMLVEKQAEIDRLNREKLSETEKLKREKADLEEKLRRMDGKEDNSNLMKQQKNTILLMSGFKNGTEHDGMVVLSADRSQWIESQLKLPYKTGRGCAVYFNEEIYLLGGGGNLKALHRLGKNLKWSRLADLNFLRYGITKSCLEWNGYIWVFGGEDEDKKARKTVQRYDPKTDKWTAMPEMKYKRAYASALLWNDRIIVSGGWGDNRVRTNTIESFNLGVWTQLANMSGPRNGHSLVNYKNALVIMGGYDGKMARDDVWSMDPLEINPVWRLLSHMKYQTSGAAGIVLDEEIYLIGGRSNSEYLDRVEIYNGENWRPGLSLPYNWTEAAAMIIPQSLADRLIAYKL